MLSWIFSPHRQPLDGGIEPVSALRRYCLVMAHLACVLYQFRLSVVSRKRLQSDRCYIDFCDLANDLIG